VFTGGDRRSRVVRYGRITEIASLHQPECLKRIKTTQLKQS